METKNRTHSLEPVRKKGMVAENRNRSKKKVELVRVTEVGEEEGEEEGDGIEEECKGGGEDHPILATQTTLTIQAVVLEIGKEKGLS